MLDHVLRYCYGTRVDLPFHEAVERTRQALLDEHFSVVSEIDMAAAIRRGLDIETNPYVVLGICNPTVLHYALGLEPDVGLIVTGSVAVYADGVTRTVISALAPELMLSLTHNPSLSPLGTAMDVRLRRAIETVQRSARARPTPVPMLPLGTTGIIPSEVLADSALGDAAQAAREATRAAATQATTQAATQLVTPPAGAPRVPPTDEIC